MQKDSILVVDFSKNAKSRKYLSQIIREKTNYNCEILTPGESPLLPSESPVKLVFLCCDCSNQKEIPLNHKSFFQAYLNIPVIGVIHCRDFCTDCYVLQKHMWNFISAPFSENDVMLNVKKYIAENALENKTNIDSIIKEKVGFSLLKGLSAGLQTVKEKIGQIAKYDVNVLINGETGSGKELCAKLIHFMSPRCRKPFIPINCGAVPRELFENELFGHKKGAYTNADSNQEGLVAAAHGGTLFLDEIESLPESMQAKLLRFLEEKKYKPLGQTKFVDADVRLIASAKERLWENVAAKKFRDDLYYRLNVVNIDVPPLRDRLEDIPVLVNHFIERFSSLYQKEINGIQTNALFTLLHNDWPGNVRELENVVQEAVVINQSGWIEFRDIKTRKLVDGKSKEQGILPFKSAKRKNVEKFEQDYLRNMMFACKGNISHAARAAHQDRRAFYRLLKKHNINPEEFKDSKMKESIT